MSEITTPQQFNRLSPPYFSTVFAPSCHKALPATKPFKLNIYSYNLANSSSVILKPYFLIESTTLLSVSFQFSILSVPSTFREYVLLYTIYPKGFPIHFLSLYNAFVISKLLSIFFNYQSPFNILSISLFCTPNFLNIETFCSVVIRLA